VFVVCTDLTFGQWMSGRDLTMWGRRGSIEIFMGERFLAKIRA